MARFVAFVCLVLHVCAASAQRYTESNLPGYKINPKPCKVKGQEGTCMFVWECIKVDGVALGMCVEGFMFGSCCALDTDTNLVPGAANTRYSTKAPAYNTTTTTTLPLTAPTTTTTTTEATTTTFKAVSTSRTTTTTSRPPVAEVAGSSVALNNVVSTQEIVAPATTTTKRPSTFRTRPMKHTTTRATTTTTARRVTTTQTPLPNIVSSVPSTTTATTVSPSDSSSTTTLKISTTGMTTTTTTTTTTATTTTTLVTTPAPLATQSVPSTTTPVSISATTAAPFVSSTTSSTSAGSTLNVSFANASSSTTTAPSTVVPSSTVTSSLLQAKPVTSLPISTASTECGVSTMAPRPETRIVGGSTSRFGSWPWQASIRRTSFFGFSSTHRCGGALLNEMWVITAGHCVEDLLVTQIRVRLGEYDFSGTTEAYPHIERAITKKIVHPKYNFFTYEHDLALVRLDEAVTFMPHISPICLPATDDLLVGEIGTVTGWGRLSEGGTLPSVLQQVSVPIVSNEKCKGMFLKAGRHEYIPDIFMCAGYETGGRDSCQGDSGGPLQIRGKDGRYFLGGIISWGIGCAEANLPGVCTRISKFTKWILDNAT